MSNDTAPRILISRMSSLGDTVLTMPIACALREEFPNAHLAWVVEKESASIIREHSALDEVIQLDSGWSKSIKEMRETARTIRTRAFDVMIDCEGTSRTALLGWLAAVPKRIGFSGPHGSLLNRILNTEQVTPVFDHLTDRSLELLIPMGNPLSPSSMAPADPINGTCMGANLASKYPQSENCHPGSRGTAKPKALGRRKFCESLTASTRRLPLSVHHLLGIPKANVISLIKLLNTLADLQV